MSFALIFFWDMVVVFSFLLLKSHCKEYVGLLVGKTGGEPIFSPLLGRSFRRELRAPSRTWDWRH